MTGTNSVVSSYPHGTQPRSLKAAFALAALMALLPGVPALAQQDTTAPKKPAAPAATQPAAPKPVIESTTELSRRLADISKKLNEAAPDVHIAMMDRDWFQQNLAVQQISPQPELGPEEMLFLQHFSDGSWQSVNQILKQMDPDAGARQKLIADFIKARTGLVEVNPERLSTFTLMMDVTDGEGLTLPGGSGPSQGLSDDKKFCTVFGEFADLDAETMTRVTSGLNGRGMNPNLDGRPLVNVLPLDILRKTVDYHEAGHCYYHAAKGIEAGDDFNAALRMKHASETYADIFAVLMLAHFDGVTNVANTLADQRIVDNALKEPFIVKAPGADQTSASYYGIFIHTTTDGLRAAQKEIDRIGGQRLQQMSVNELRQLAFRILDSVPAPGFEEAFMLTELQKHVYDDSFLAKFLEDNPEMTEASKYALRMRDEMNAAIPRIVDISHLDPNKKPLEQIQFNFEQTQVNPLVAMMRMQAQQELMVKLMNELKDKLIADAGGAAATDSTLVRAFDAQKDVLRHVLESGATKEERIDAMRKLAVIGESMNQAVIKVDGPRVPAVDSAPGFQPPKDPLNVAPGTVAPPLRTPILQPGTLIIR